jgi:hypothetical protein
MARKAGRPCKYDTHVKPYLNDIKEYCTYMTEEQIAKTLGVSVSAWCEYKNKYPELNDALKKGRADLVRQLRSTLIQRAKGFKFEEKKTIKEKGKVVREEIYQRSALPDVAALNLLLKNYDPDNWANDPQALKLRERELELREKQIESNDW